MSATDTSKSSIFEQLERLASSGDGHSAIELLIDHLDRNKQFHELFEALKMRLRLRLGLNLAQAEPEEKFDEARELELEQGLLEACRQVGERFLREGKIREGWMYLRPVGDRQAAAKAFSGVQADDENLDEFIEVLVHEGVDVPRGYQLALDRLGTCNSITLFESALAARPRADQQAAAKLLVDHVHTELMENLKRDLEQREGELPQERSLEEILQSRPDLLRDGTYHLDTSHIASTVRFARVLDDLQALEKALDITGYGLKLHPQYQYPGEEPFLDLYPSSAAFFRALLGRQVDAGIRYFTHKADVVDQNQFGTVAIEVLIDLLSRCGRQQEALETYQKRLPKSARIVGIAPSLLQISQRLGDFQLMCEISKERDDLLGYAAALLQAKKR